MRIAILVTTYNRPEYLERCLQSLNAADLHDAPILIVDDASTDKKTLKLIHDFNPAYFLQSKKNLRVVNSLILGYEFLFDRGFDIVINLDSDAIVRNDFFAVLMKLYVQFPDYLITGFNCLTKNADGSERHKIITAADGFNTKKSVGGINMVVSKKAYDQYVRPALYAARDKGNWDHMACINSEKANKPIICAVPSVVQHIGIKSSMGHTSTEAPDTADDFKQLHLPQVTLIGIDCVDINRLISAAEACEKNIVFGSVKLLSSIPSKDPRVKRIKPVTSIEQYSRFMMKELAKHVTTSHMLVIQYDGYVVNAAAWSKEFLAYDYIGAPWWYKDGMNVGNGGFSLRSKRLMEICAMDNHIKVFHPEDHHICRTYRKYLEKRYNIQFAPDKIADRFSVEGWMHIKKHDGQFGFHGRGVDVGQKVQVIDVKKQVAKTGKPPLIISQFQGLGDILFAMPLVNDWIKEGHKIIWPVVPQYVSLNKHFPLVTFVDMNIMPIDYDRKDEHMIGGCKYIPLRWCEVAMKLPYHEVMKAKYKMYGKHWERWRELSWSRDIKAEDALFKLLNIRPGEKYNLVNYNFRTDQTGKVDIKITNKYRIIKMEPVAGFTMLDWGKVIENATEIHTPGTSIQYMLEVMNVKAAMHLYVRKPDEKDFSLYDYLLSKQYHFHR